MRFARFSFLIAGIYGLIVVAPEYFLEARYGQDYPPPITHPEFFYGFVGLCLVFQLLFLLIAANPVRFRPIMLIAIAEKLCFVIPAVTLHLQGRLNPMVTGFSLVDLLWATLFTISFLRTCAPVAAGEKLR